jgi:hypothetical protein
MLRLADRGKCGRKKPDTHSTWWRFPWTITKSYFGKPGWTCIKALTTIYTSFQQWTSTVKHLRDIGALKIYFCIWTIMSKNLQQK